MILHDVRVKDLSAGLAGALARFERAVRDDAWGGQLTPEERLLVKESYLKIRQAFLRKLFRIENGNNEAHIEQLKREFRRLAYAYTEKCIDGTDNSEMFKMSQDIISGSKRL